MSPVTLTVDGSVGVIVVDNPPVNAVSNAVRVGLVRALQDADRNSAVDTVVLACAGRTFIAGADIAEFGKPLREPTTLGRDRGDRARCPSRWSPALHGTPLGGGLEVALACHFRVAAPARGLALPEIKLGLMPGAGGTQRLPRLVGMDKAIDDDPDRAIRSPRRRRLASA